MRRRMPGSRAPNGSSIRRMRGSRMSVAAIATRCCIPPERAEGNSFSEPSSPTFFNQSAARSRRSERPTPRSCRPKAMFSNHVQVGQERVFWSTSPRSGPGSLHRLAQHAHLAAPSAENAAASPAMMRRSVDLPQPEGPTIVTNSPTFGCVFDHERDVLNRHPALRDLPEACW